MKHDYFQKEKLEYEEIEIPDELLYMVRKTVAESRKKQAAKRKAYIIKMAGAVAAVLFLSLSVGVNSSYAVAETAVKIPVVKEVAQAVVMRSYRPQIIEVYEAYKVSKQPEKAPEEMPEPPSEEIVSTESGNDVTAQETVQPTVAQPSEEPVKETEKIDVWKAEMTSEKLKEVTELYTPKMEEEYAETPEKLRTILLAELAEEDISLYGYHEDGKQTGVALRIGDKYQYFDWTYMNESGKLPEVSCNDLDGDGTEEVVILLYNEKLPKKETVTENDTVSGTETTAVSDNDAALSEKQQVGEVWVITPKEGEWTAAVLSVKEYEEKVAQQKETHEKGTVSGQTASGNEPKVEAPIESGTPATGKIKKTQGQRG